MAVAYAVVLVSGLATLIVVILVGKDYRPTPSLAPDSLVSGPGDDCLGARLVALQSGTFLSLHVPGAEVVKGSVGTTVLRGRVDRSGVASMSGHCAPGTTLVGEGVTARVTIVDGEAMGTLNVGGRLMDLRLGRIAATTPTVPTAEEPLEGAALVGRVCLAIAVVLLASQLMGAAFGRIRLTRVIGEIVAGIMLGPSLLGSVWPALTDFLFPAAVTDFLTVLGQIGLILFMFLIGLELDLPLVRRTGHRALLVSHVSIIVPFSLGIGLALVAYPLLGTGKFLGFALFMGAAMAITAFPVLARILADTGLSRTPLGALAITCAAVDDATAWCILAAVVAIVNSTGLGDTIVTVGLLVTFVIGMAMVARPTLRRAAAYLQRSPAHRSDRPESIVVPLVLLGLLLSAWATEEIGVHAIFGAFIFGVVMPRTPRVTEGIEAKFGDVTRVLLLPVFFAMVGLTTRISLLDRAELWLFTLLVFVVAVVGKLGGSAAAARVSGCSGRESAALGVLMNTRGLTEIVILTVGQGLGVISPALFAMMVLMALTTTVMATPLLGLVYPKRLQFADAETGSVRVDPSRRSTFRIMVAVVEPAEVGPVLRLAVDLRPDGKTPALILTHVVDASLVGERTAERDALALSRAEVGSLAASVVGSSSSVRVRTSLSARPGRCLADLALSDRADLVLVRWQTFGGDVSRETLLSDLIETASCDLAAVVDERVAPDWKTDGSRPIMVWLQGTVHDDAALSLATALGRGSRVALRLVLTDGAVQPGPSAGTDAGSVVRVDPTHDEWLEVFGAGSLVVMGLPGKSEVARRRFDLLTTGGLPESTLVVVRSSRARGHARSWPLPANRGPESEQFQAAGGGQ